MEAILVLALLCGGLFWFFRKNTERGRRFVRAHLFLQAIEQDCPVKEANGVARMFGTKYSDSESDARAIHRAREYSTLIHGGKQLPIIAEAVSKGFQG